MAESYLNIACYPPAKYGAEQLSKRLGMKFLYLSFSFDYNEIGAQLKSLVKEMPGKCPKDGGTMVVRQSKKGRVYYGCANYPACEFMTWEEPTAEVCPQCGSSLFKKGGKSGTLNCLKEGCGFSKPVDK